MLHTASGSILTDGLLIICRAPFKTEDSQIICLFLLDDGKQIPISRYFIAAAER